MKKKYKFVIGGIFAIVIVFTIHHYKPTPTPPCVTSNANFVK